ncbi:MAG: tRNA (adenosine(37)-N6)-threonylcarbamoyltransferase complex transferase subunit TsaD [Candidatus Aminicenantes bacterium]|nr:tRNA (adenosine(37)-N6)-threonylcarbamoyltransferase complex transferase subunit TsaD [Candidatus Aminicenantes bacterium]
MLLLGIETSCDETAAAVLDDQFSLLSSVVLSQEKIHAPYGGIVPELASREHIRSIVHVVAEAVRRAGIDIQKIDVYAVTQGPGLIGSLLVGLSFAKGLAYIFGKPLVPVDHVEAHIHSTFLENPDVLFPALALVVSGGHTSLFAMGHKLDYRLVGKTRDDAAGEALDKIAKHLDLGYPGGPLIDKLAEKGDQARFPFGLPHMTDGSLDFSFSGLKTAALKTIRRAGIKKGRSGVFCDFLASFQMAVIRALMENLERAVRKYRPRSLILSGGVARNRSLRKEFQAFAGKKDLKAYVPNPSFCTDNAAMVAALGLEQFRSGGSKAGFPLDLNAYPRREARS